MDSPQQMQTEGFKASRKEKHVRSRAQGKVVHRHLAGCQIETNTGWIIKLCVRVPATLAAGMDGRWDRWKQWMAGEANHSRVCISSTLTYHPWSRYAAALAGRASNAESLAPGAEGERRAEGRIAFS